ncbi:MAG: FAD-dependent oxidoreductase, partial [Gammaproteobacteria bacterium]|nr:FAD-dependent oxidoreductase [Gammaproteobacteria bacterium]NIR85839.1 FAD-dependent oxidoreductase [Gammaproteobacteria bacterium]NIR90595.1 FAD-dependent oxidoreductase [Gammaproteobacteria bacterium]NIU06974.1 FAD-dependent oxidoreductase [Gammaproteobacteria bacterium]NIV75887.1 FAD-dependent oxidoreductase [Gammaproteobacteria bacterium]
MGAATDCVVIGGGVNGLLTARELASPGCAVTLIERGGIGREASWAAGAILSPLYPWRQPAAVTALAKVSEDMYPDLITSLHEETGIDPEWLASGFLILDAGEADAAGHWAVQTRTPLEVVTPEHARELEPALGACGTPVIWLPRMHQIRPPRFIRALHESVRRAGVDIREETTVTDLIHRQGRIQGVQTSRGYWPAACVVVAAGAWSGELLRPLNLHTTVEPVRGQMVLLRARPGTLRRIVLRDGRYVIPRREGAVVAGSTLENTGFDQSTTAAARLCARGGCGRASRA